MDFICYYFVSITQKTRWRIVDTLYLSRAPLREVAREICAYLRRFYYKTKPYNVAMLLFIDTML